MGRAKKKGAKRMWAADRRKQLLDVATDILSEKGSQALRLDTLAAAAGVSRPVVYEHFRGREALILALIEDYSGLLLDRLREAFSRDPDDIRKTVRNTTSVYFDCVKERGLAIRTLLAGSGDTPEIEKARIAIRRQVGSIWVGLIAEHTGLGPKDSAAVSAAMIAAAWSLVGQWSTGSISRRRAEELYVQLAEAALETFSRNGA